jgi:two-component system, NarL family, sensor histidine kinase DevS
MATVRDMAPSRRETWLLASMDITSAVLAGVGPQGLWPLLAESALAASGADVAIVVLPTSDPEWLTIAAAVGDGAQALRGRSVPPTGSISALAIVSGQPVVWDDWANDDRLYPPARSWVAPFGPGMGVPIAAPQSAPLGALAVAKRRGRPGFDDQDVAMLISFAAQAVLARRLDDHRGEAEQLRLLEERDRIARDLHDHVIQELFAAGMTLQSVAAAVDAEPGEQQRRRLLGTVGQLDDVIGQIRTTIFGLRPQPIPHQQSADGVREPVLEVVREAAGALGFAPSLHFAGPVELVTAPVAGDLVAVVREALSNAARHAHATDVTVEVTASAMALTVRVADNGRGMDEATRRSGLHNLRVRAERQHGTLSVVSCAGGTTLTWTVPLDTHNVGLGRPRRAGSSPPRPATSRPGSPDWSSTPLGAPWPARGWRDPRRPEASHRGRDIGRYPAARLLRAPLCRRAGFRARRVR